ncbi:MAG: hypothetical protein J2P52_06530 [Blastocatellia bacterium]|nr:hypothetical protein [Blastocatellia bacterium]
MPSGRRRWPFSPSAGQFSPGRQSPQWRYSQWPSRAPSGGTSDDYRRAARYLKELADRSGGRLYDANTLYNVSQAFSNIAEELRRQYALSYYPTNSKKDGSYRRVKVRIEKPGMIVRAREGYRAAAEIQAKNDAGGTDRQLKMPGERQADALPQELTEAETQNILKEKSPKPHVDAALKVSDMRLASALKFVEDNQYKSAAQDVDVYASLIVYADAYTRKLPASQIKDRSNCLKKIEQAIFKQTRMVDAALRQFPVDYREGAEVRIDQVKKIRLRVINDLLGDGRMIKTSDE